MAKECHSLVRHCRNCNRTFEPFERMVNCPECDEDRTCGNYASTYSDNCQQHGGAAPKRGYYGKGGANTKGKESRFPIVRLAAKYLKIQQNPELSTLRPLHTLVAGRIVELFDRLAEGNMPEKLAGLHNAWSEFQRTHPNLEGYYHSDSAKTAYNKIDEVMEAVFHDYAAWDQILKLIDEKRKLSESEMKILKDMKVLMSADDVYDMWARLLAAVTKVIDDPNILKAIQHEFARIVEDEDSSRPESGSGTVIEGVASGVDPGELLHPRDAGGSALPGEDIPPTLPEGHADGGVPEG